MTSSQTHPASSPPCIDQSPLITFLVVVRNEAGQIERCVNTMLDQTLPHDQYEIVVVDGMSSDGTRDIVARIITANPDRFIRLIDNPRRILSSGWNLGFAHARGDFVIRPDAHASVPRDFLERSLEVMRAQPHSTAVGGYTETCGEGFWGEVVAAVISSKIGVGASSFRVGAEPGPMETVVFGLYRRKDVIETGGFDEGVVLNQDNVFHARLRAAGKTLYFDPRIRSTYFCRSSLSKLWKQMFRRGQWLILMFKHQKEGNFSLRYYVPLVFVLGMIGLLIGGAVWLPLWIVLAALLALYTGIGMAVAAGRGLRPAQIPAFPLAMFVLHFSYGLGELAGFLRYPFYQPDLSRRTPLLNWRDAEA